MHEEPAPGDTKQEITFVVRGVKQVRLVERVRLDHHGRWHLYLRGHEVPMPQWLIHLIADMMALDAQKVAAVE